MPRVGDFADDSEVEFPLFEDGGGHLFLARLQHHEHALLAFAEHHLVRRHAFFAARHLVHVETNARLAVGGHFDARGGEASCAHVLDGDDRIGRHQFEASLDQQLLGERIAHLHGGALGVRVFFEIGAGHGCTVDPVTAGLRPDIDDRIAHAGRGRIEDLVGIGDAHGHRIDEDVAVIGGVEIGFARDGRDAHAIAIAADARNHALDQVLHLGMFGAAEAQRVGVRHRARAHGEDIAQDAAHAGRCALIGLDIARVVVALHLEDGGLPVPDIDNARIFARPADHPRRLGRQLLEVQSRALVAAVFGPHDREDTQLDEIGLAAQCVEHALVFFGAEAVLFDDFGGDRGFDCCHARALSLASPRPPDPPCFYASASTVPRRPSW